MKRAYDRLRERERRTGSTAAQRRERFEAAAAAACGVCSFPPCVFV